MLRRIAPFPLAALRTASNVCSASCFPDLYVKATFAPSWANRIAIARPMPVEAPVIRTFFPSSFPMAVSSESVALIFPCETGIIFEGNDLCQYAHETNLYGRGTPHRRRGLSSKWDCEGPCRTSFHPLRCYRYSRL